MKTQKAVTVQSVLAEWHAFTVQDDFWPRFVHQRLIDATAGVMPEATRPEKADIRVLATEALYVAVREKSNPLRRSICGRLASIEAWLRSKPSPGEIAEKFSKASRYAEAY